MTNVELEREVAIFEKFKGQIGELPDALRTEAIRSLTDCRTEVECQNMLVFIRKVAGLVGTAPPGVLLLCLRGLLRTHSGVVRAGGDSNKLSDDVDWIRSNILPLNAPGYLSSTLMCSLLRRRFWRLSSRDGWLLGAATLIQVVAVFLIFVFDRNIEFVVTIEGIALLFAAWLVGKCEGINRNAWNDIMAGFAFLAVITPLAVKFIKFLLASH